MLSVLLGINLPFFGLFRLISTFSTDEVAPGLAGFVGVIGMIAGVVVVRHPFQTVAVLATVWGVMWIVGGSIDFMSAVADRRERDRVWLGFTSAMSVIAGIVVCVGAFRLKSLDS